MARMCYRKALVVAVCLFGTAQLPAQTPDQLYAKAEQEMNAGNFRSAVKTYRQFFSASKTPDDKYKEAQLRMASCLSAIGEPIQAGRIYQDFTQQFPGDPRQQDLRLKLARSYEARGDFLKAIAAYKDLLVRFPNYPQRRELRVYLCHLYQDILNDPKRALKEYQQLLRENRDQPEAAELEYAIARVFETKSQDFLKARDAYTVLVENHPDHPLAEKAQLKLAELSDGKGARQYAVAAVHYRKYLEKYPAAENRQPILERLAFLYLERLKQYQNAADAYEALLKFKDTPQLRLARLRALEKTQNPDRILPVYREFMEKHAKSQEARNAARSLANLLWESERREEALQELTRLVASDPTSIEDRMELARRQTEAAKYDEALKTYREIAELRPSGDLFVRMAACPLTRVTKIREAQKEADPEATEFPDTPEILKSYEQAEAVLKDAVAKFPKHADIVTKASWSLAAAVYEPQEKHQEAGEALKPIFERFPGHAHYADRSNGIPRLLTNYRRAERLELAEELLLKCATRYPGYGRIREALAELVGHYVLAVRPPEPPEEIGEDGKPKPKPPVKRLSPEKAKDYLSRAVNVARRVLQEDDSDTAAALATVYMAEAFGELGDQLQQLRAFARMASFAADKGFQHLSTLFDERRRGRVRPILDSLTREEEALDQWRFKQDPNNEGEKQNWVAAELDASWKTAAAGKDWGEFDGYGWYQIEVKHTGSPEAYRITFESVDDEAWVYVNGALSQYHNKPEPLTFPFTIAGTDEGEVVGSFRLSVRVRDKGEQGGLTGKVTLLKPKPLDDKDLLRAALCNQALGRLELAAEQYESYLKLIARGGVPAGQDDPRALMAEMKTELRLLNGEVEGIEAALSETPDALLLLRLARIYEGQQAEEKSLQFYTRAREAAPNKLLCIRMLAGAYERQRQYEKAIAENFALLEKLPKEADPSGTQRHIIWLATDRWQNTTKAREFAHQFAEQQPGPGWERTLGDLYKDRHPADYTKALEHYRNYMADAGKADIDVWHGGVSQWDLLNRLQKYDEAIAYAKAWREQFLGHPRALEMIYLVGQTFRNQGKVTDASKTFLEVIEQYPGSYAAFLCATTAIDAFSADIREGIVSKWFELNPGDTRAAEIYFRLGQRYEPEQGGIPRAIEAYRTVWESFRDKWNENVRAADRLNYLLFSAGKADEGAEVAKEILAKFGNQGHGEVLNAWYRLLDYYGPRSPFRAEVDTTLSTGTTPQRITDGRTDGGKGNPGYAWLSAVSPREHWVDCMLYRSANVNTAHLCWGHEDELPKAYKLQFKRGEEFVDIPGFEQWRAAKEVAEQLRFTPVTTDCLRVVQAGSGGSTARPNEMIVAEIRLFELQPEESAKQYTRFVEMMTEAFPNRTEAFHARSHLATFYLLRGDYVQANIETQKMIFQSPPGDTWHWDSTVGLAQAKSRAERHGEAAAILRTLLKVNVGFSDKARVADAEKSLGEALTASGSGMLVIDPNAPEAGLLWGNAFALSGEEELAWQRYVENVELFPQHQHKLSADYLALIVRRLLAAKEIKSAVEICSSFLAHRAGDKLVSDSDKAEMTILLGDCYYRDERYEIAREHFMTASAQYAKTPEGTEAKFKIITVFLAQKVFDKAQEILDELLKSREIEVIIRAHIMRGILYHHMGDKKAAVNEFRDVLMMSPGAETADEIIFRLGSVYHEQGRYKEAVDTLKLIGAWSGETRSVVEIGGEMRIRVSDRDLTLTRGSAEVPVIVQVIGPDGEKRDRERVLLQKSEAGAGLFVGSIMTKLGEPEPGDRTLQVTGADVISYFYDPDFARDFIIEAGEMKEFSLRVASTGELLASSTEIKEEDEIPVAADSGIFGPKEKRPTDFRDETQVKPENNIYLQVIDFDLDRTSEPDTVIVEVAASSGDVVLAKLEETEAHSGKFKGQVVTGFRPPDAIASDASEGHEAISAIDGNPDPQKCWMGLMDGQTPKWLQVDLKNVFPLNKIVWHRGEGARDREPIRYLIQVSEDNQQWQTAATFPEDWNYHDRLVYGPLTVRTLPNYIGDPQNLREIMDMCELAPRLYGEGRVDRIHQENGNPFGPDEYYIAVFWGNFYCPETGTYEFAVDSDDAAFMLVDGDLVSEFPGNHAAANNWEQSGKIYLKKGVHKMTYYFQEWEIIQVAKAGWKLPSKAEFEEIPRDYFDPGKYPELAKKEKLSRRKFAVKESKDGYGATITFEPRKARYIRMLIEEFHSDAPALATFEVWAGEKRIVPAPGVDIHSLAGNEVLELTPGDAITASYTDEMNVEPGTPVVLRENLHVTFFNGHVGAFTRQWIEDERTGQRRKADLLTARVNAGDPLIVRVTDYDLDISDGLDKVKFVIRTLVSEKEYEFVAKEAEPFTGIFEAEIQTSPEEKPGAVVLVAGDTMELAYVDRENTEPGNPTERNWKVVDNQASLARVRVLPFGEDVKGEEKWDPTLRLISLEEGLTVEVTDPDNCLHEGSVIRVRLEGSEGKDTAVVECKVAGTGTGGLSLTGAPTEQLVAALSKGLFRGHIKTLLGDSTSPDFIIQAAGMFDEETVRKVKSKKSGGKGDDEAEIPVLNVSGQDLITVTYVDEQSPNNPLATDITAAARILSNGTVGLFDDTYEEPVDTVHIGENVFVQVEDYDSDTSAEHDLIEVEIQTSCGDVLTCILKETLSHSGIFSAALPLQHAIKPKPGDEQLEADYGSQLKVRYLDERNTDADGPTYREAEAGVVAGSDGVVSAFSKKYPSDEVAVETEFKIGECFYYMGKEHMQMKKMELAQKEIKEGRQVLRDLLTYFPGSPLVDQAAFMLGNLDMEEKRYDDAIVTYRRITRDHPDSPIAPEAQFATGRSYESKGEFDKACEEYVKLAYKYPESAQLPEAMIRIGLYYFEKKDYQTAISVFQRYIERYPDDENTQKVYFKMGLAHILGESFVEGAEHFKNFVDKFPASTLTPAALYWAGDAFLKGRDALHAYQMFKRCVWEYPDTKWAKFARGRLTSPVFDRIAEME